MSQALDLDTPGQDFLFWMSLHEDSRTGRRAPLTTNWSPLSHSPTRGGNESVGNDLEQLNVSNKRKFAAYSSRLFQALEHDLTLLFREFSVEKGFDFFLFKQLWDKFDFSIIYIMGFSFLPTNAILDRVYQLLNGNYMLVSY